MYGVVLVTMPDPVAPVEVRHEPVFHSVRVVAPLPEGLSRSGVPDFDDRYQAYTSDPHAALTVLSAEGPGAAGRARAVQLAQRGHRAAALAGRLAGPRRRRWSAA